MSAKEEFISIYTSSIHREGADALLDYLENRSDFFTAPASARYHGAYAGGLCQHSLNGGRPAPRRMQGGLLPGGHPERKGGRREVDGDSYFLL